MGIKAKDFAEIVEKAYNENWGYIWGTAGESWTEAKQKNLKAKYESDPQKYSDYKLGAQYGSKWIGHKVADCSGLVKWALNQLGLKGIYHGSNSQFNKNCFKTGRVVKGESIPVGALIFTGSAVGQHNHVGILTSPTCVTEAQGTIKGIVHTPLSNKKWTWWGLVNGVDYEDAPDVDPVPEEEEIHITLEITVHALQKGDKGSEVKLLQKLLMLAGEALPKYGADGDFGSETLKAVKSYQTRYGLAADGVVGEKTWKSIISTPFDILLDD